MITQLNDFSQALATVLQSLNLESDQLKIKVPKGLWKKVSELLNLTGLKTERGKEWSLGNCSAFFERHNKDVMDLLNSSDSITNLTEEKCSETRQPKRKQRHSVKISKGTDMALAEDSPTPGSLSESIKEEMRKLVRNEVDRILMNRTNLKGSDSKYPMAPQAPLVGKKLLGKRVKLSVTVDEVLNQLVMDAAKELSQTYGQVIDNALWMYFGQPLLSFQRDEDE